MNIHRPMLILLVLAAVLAAAGCQKATFYEKYNRTPAKTTSVQAGQDVAQVYTVTPVCAEVPKDGTIFCWANSRWYRLDGDHWTPCDGKVQP